MVIHGNTSAIIGDRNGIARLVQNDMNGVGIAVQVFIDCVIDDLPDEMVQPLLVGIADVHRRPAAHRLEAFKDGDVFGGIGGGWHAEIAPLADVSRSQDA